MPVRIDTTRLVIRELTARDFGALHAYASDPEVVRYMPFGPNSQEESARVLKSMIADQAVEPRERFTLALVARDIDEVVGVAGLNISAREHAEGHIGYSLQRRFWNQGYATEACVALLRFGFETLGLHRIQTTVTVQNGASIRVLEKIGMRKEGLLVEHLRIHGQWMDSFVFAILAREWQSASGGARAPSS